MLLSALQLRIELVLPIVFAMDPRIYGFSKIKN